MPLTKTAILEKEKMRKSRLMTERLSLLLKQARIARHRGGLKEFVSRASQFPLKPIYRHGIHYLYQYEIEETLYLEEVNHRPNIDGLIPRVISSNREADELEVDGFEFRSCATDWNMGLNTYHNWLDKGAIAFCIFIGHELATISWVFTSQQTHDSLSPTIPVKIDYSNREVFSRGAWTDQKYRGLGLYRYNIIFNRNRFLAAKGVTIVRASISQYNLAGQSLLKGLGYEMYAKAHMSKWIFGQWTWKEIHCIGKQFPPQV